MLVFYYIEGTLLIVAELNSEIDWPKVASQNVTIEPNIVSIGSSGLGWLNIKPIGVCIPKDGF